MKQTRNIPNSLISSAVDEWVQGDINRAILKDRHINLMCYEPLAEKYYISVSTVKRILNRYDPVVFAHIDRELKKRGPVKNEFSAFLPLELVGI